MQLNDLRNLDKEDVLNKIGLQSYSRGIVPGATLFGLGLLLGAGIGILFAPKAGSDLRHDLMGRVDDLKNSASERFHREGTTSSGSDVGSVTASDFSSAT